MEKTITSEFGFKETYQLIDASTKMSIFEGETIVTFRGEKETLTANNSHPPKHHSSTGRVNGKFPSVFGLKWVWIG